MDSKAVATRIAGSERLAEHVRTLAQVPAFDRLPPTALELLAASGEQVRYSAGAQIIREGDLGDHAYVVIEGHAEAWTEGSDGRITLVTYGPAALFGEMALLLASQRREATVDATTELVALRIPADNMKEVLTSFPEMKDVLHSAAEAFEVGNFLRRAGPFANLSGEQAQHLAGRLRPLTVEPGAVIVLQGEVGDTCFLLRDGKVAVLSRMEDGTERQIATLGPGMLFGEGVLLTGEPRNATVQAIESCRMLALSRSDLLETLEDDARIGRRMREMVQLRERPQRVAGVEEHEQTLAGGRNVVILKDPARSAYYQLSPEGHFIWRLLDGDHTFRDIAIGYLRTFKAFAPDLVAVNVAGLAAAGFVRSRSVREEVGGGDDVRSAWRRAIDLAGGAIQWQVSTAKVDEPITWLYRHGVRPLFTPPGQVLLALLGLIGVVTFIANLGQVDSATSHGGWMLLSLIGLYGIVVVLHEAGHAFTVKALGHQIPRAGVGWYWFGPMAYVDTSDMWIAGRWKRIAVNLGGPYSTFLVAAMVTLVAAQLGSSLLAGLFWQLALISYLTVLLNLNPLLELDGYYVLMDWLDRPNLRRDCLRWLGSNLGSAIRHPSRLSGHWLEGAYGAAAILYILVMIAVVLLGFRPVIQAWIGSILPTVTASVLAWLFALGLVGLSLAATEGDLRPATST